MLIDHGLKHVRIHLFLVHDDRVMSRASRALDCGMGVQVEVVTKRLGDIAIDQGTWNRVAILVASKTLLGEEADVMTLLGNNDGKVDLYAVSIGEVIGPDEDLPCSWDCA